MAAILRPPACLSFNTPVCSDLMQGVHGKDSSKPSNLGDEPGLGPGNLHNFSFQSKKKGTPHGHARVHVCVHAYTKSFEWPNLDR